MENQGGFKEELLIIAKSILLDFKPSKWDSVGWGQFNVAVKALNPTPHDTLAAWRAAIDLQHKAYTHRYRVYAAAQGLHADFNPNEKQEREAETFAAAMTKWDDVRIKKIERVGNILRFFTENNRHFQMTVEESYSQAFFRKAYTVGTSLYLPTIDPPSYEKFMLSFKLTEVGDVGTSLREKIDSILLSQHEKFQDAVLESEKDAVEAVHARGWAVLGNEIFFKSEKLLHELRKATANTSMEILVSSLRDSGATIARDRRFNYWRYVVGRESGAEDENNDSTHD